MLFVFGYRANKIRNKKVSGLIHKSEQHPDVRQATVEVHFCMINDHGDSTHDFDVIPESRFVVSRSANRDNSSSYAVDGRKTNFKEVGTLLRSKGIDLDHNRFLILQGEVEQISQMKPKAENKNEEGMLEYLEDIIGSSRLKPFIEKLTNQVEQLNEHRTQRNERVKLAEIDRNRLKDEFDEAKQWTEVKNQLTRDINLFHQAEARTSERVVEKTEKFAEEYKEKAATIDGEIQTHKSEFKEVYKAHEKATKKMAKIEKAMQANNDLINDLEAKNQQLHEEKKLKKKRKNELAKNIRAEQSKVEKFAEMPEKCKEQEEELNEKIETAQNQEKAAQAELEKAIESVERDTDKLRREKEPLEKKMMEKQEVTNALAQKKDEAKNIQATFTEKYDRAVDELAKMKEEVETIKESSQEQAKEHEALTEEVPQLEKEVKHKDKRLSQLQDKRAHIQGKHDLVKTWINSFIRGYCRATGEAERGKTTRWQ